MAMRSLAPFATISYDSSNGLHPMLLAVSEHALLWRHTRPIAKTSSEFPAHSLRLLPDNARNTNGYAEFYFFLTPLALGTPPSTATRPLTQHATCVLPLRLQLVHCTVHAGCFRKDTELLMGMTSPQGAWTIVRITSNSSPLFDGDDVTFVRLIPCISVTSKISVVDMEEAPSGSLRYYEVWHAAGEKKETNGEAHIISSDFLMELAPPSAATELDDFVAAEIYELLKRRPRYRPSTKTAGELAWSTQLATALFRPTQFTAQAPSARLANDEDAVMSMLGIHTVGERSVTCARAIMQEQAATGRVIRQEQPVCSVAASQRGRVVGRFGKTLYTGVFRSVSSTLEEVARDACFGLLSERAKQHFWRERAVDFQSLGHFFTNAESNT